MHPEFGGRVIVRIAQGFLLCTAPEPAVEVVAFPKPKPAQQAEPKARRQYFPKAGQREAMR